MRLLRLGKGFTLIELLLVVAIISLLLSISVPGMARARIASGRAKCMSQLKEIAHTVQMYLNEYKDVMPHCAQKPTDEPDVAAAADPPRSPYVPIYHVDAFGHFLKTHHLDPQPPGGFTKDEYLDYISNGERNELFRCPADRGELDPPPGVDPHKPMFDLEGTSYEWNADVNGHRVLGRIFGRQPSDVFLRTLEDTWLVRDFDCFHGGKDAANSLVVLYGDMHVQTE